MKEVFEKFKDINVLVFGDVMLDQYLIGNSERISPEAPVPVVKLQKKKFIPGGAGNVAANIAGLGGKPILSGVIGSEQSGEDLLQALREKNVSGDYIYVSGERPTTLKTRVIANNQQVARIDLETSAELSAFEEAKVWEKLESGIGEADILVISDYNKGTVAENICMRLITKANELNIKTIIDPKGKTYQKYKSASLITPNKSESVSALDSYSKHLKRDFTLETFLSELELEAILVTEGEKGMTLYQDKEVYKLEAKTRKVFDVTGAGDTVIAVMAMSVAAGADYFRAAEVANLAAGLVVEEVGTSVVKFNNLVKYIYPENKK